MRQLRPFAAVFATVMVVMVAAAAAPTFPARLVAGTLYTIRSAHSPTPMQSPTDTAYVAEVAMASGRGRMDVVSGAEPPMFKAGDYILFDTTGYVIVHPSTKTYSTIPDFSAMSGQIGDMMKLSDVKISIDTLERGTVNGMRATHYRTNMSFTMTMDMSSFGVSAAQAPPPMRSDMKGDVWYADSIEETPNPFLKTADQLPAIPFISPILDEMKKVRASLPAHRLAVKMENSVHVNAMGQENTNHSVAEITDFRRGDVDVSRLVLPPDYMQTAIPGMEMLGPPTPLTPDALAKWRAVPRG